MRTALLVVLVLGACLGVAAPLSAEPLAPAPVTTLDVTAAAAGAVTAMMQTYDPSDGLPDPDLGWWSSAIMLDSVVRYELVTGDRRWVPTLVQAYRVNPWAGTVAQVSGVRWANGYVDDSLWWALTWLDGYRLTGRTDMLADAEGVVRWAERSWTSMCGGGVLWARPWIQGFRQQNAITNALFLRLNAELWALTGQPGFRYWADRTATWLTRLRLPDGTLADHLTQDGTCTPTGGYATYSQGEAALGLAEIGDTASARALADAAVRRGLPRDGCEATQCADERLFKGPMVDGIGQVNALLPGRPYSAWLAADAQMAYTHDRAAGNRYGYRWAGPVVDWKPVDQAAVIDLFTADEEGQTGGTH